jgi:hypothetical protein
LALGEISDHYGAFNQFVGDQMGHFMKTISLLVALLLGDAARDFGETKIAAGLLLALVSLGTDLV